MCVVKTEVKIVAKKIISHWIILLRFLKEETNASKTISAPVNFKDIGKNGNVINNWLKNNFMKVMICVRI